MTERVELFYGREHDVACVRRKKKSGSLTRATLNLLRVLRSNSVRLPTS
jgi:hypothetical protein